MELIVVMPALNNILLLKDLLLFLLLRTLVFKLYHKIMEGQIDSAKLITTLKHISKKCLILYMLKC